MASWRNASVFLASLTAALLLAACGQRGSAIGTPAAGSAPAPVEQAGAPPAEPVVLNSVGLPERSTKP